MTLLPQRAGALLIDLCLANLIGGLLVLPFFVIAEDPIRVMIPTTPFMICFAMMVMTFALEGNTLGKRMFDLELSGDGCLICREIQRLGWYMMLGSAPILSLVVPIPNGLLFLAVVAWVVLAFVLPLVQSKRDFPHNTTTGFQIVQKVRD